MKKLFNLFIAAAFVLTLFPAVASAHTEDSPFKVDLIAGQNMDVGDVLVWNDADNLYVKYELSGNWCLLESHVAVGGLATEIPQTKKENPVPGKFLYSASYDNPPCEQSPDPYVIPLEWSAGQPAYIAAHASVAQPKDGCYESVWQIGDVEVVNEVTGWLENYADEFNWGDPAGPTTAGPSLAVEQPAFTDPFIVGKTPTEEFPYNSNFNRGYATDFDVQWDGGLPFGGVLTLSWSPGQSATEKKVVSDGFPTTTLTASGSPRPGEGWFLDTYSLVEHSVAVDPLLTGSHTIRFQHTQGDGTFWDWVRLEKPCEQHETGWGEGTQFEGSNWGMYFTYDIQGVCPAVTSSSNVNVLPAPLEDVRQTNTTSDTPQIFAEYVGTDHGGFKLDIDANNVIDLNGHPVDAGDPVCSYYIHYDDGTYKTQNITAGHVTFDADVMGLIVAGSINPNDIFYLNNVNTMCDTDSKLGSDSTIYPGADCGINGDARGLEIFSTDPTASRPTNQDPVEIVGDTVNFDLLIANKHDSFRIILPALP